MFEQLPSLLGFQPRFYRGGPIRFHLPLLYDLVATAKPKVVVALGFGDGQAFFTLCQAVREQEINCHCVAIRRDHGSENENDDVSWIEGKEYGDEFYGDMARFCSASDALREVADGSVDILLLDDCDSGFDLLTDLGNWEGKLSPNGLVMLHGIGLQRSDDPKFAWHKWAGSRRTVELTDGIGLGVVSVSDLTKSLAVFDQHLLSAANGAAGLSELYRLAAKRIEAQARANEAVRTRQALEARQVWIDSLLTDRWKVQEVMDHQEREISHRQSRLDHLQSRLDYVQAKLDNLQQDFEDLHADRAKAQLVMDSQQEELRQWAIEGEKLQVALERLKTQFKEQKKILNAGKSACRKKGRCFQISEGPKQRRSFGEKVVREIRRLPRNLRITRDGKRPTPPVPAKGSSPEKPIDRYAEWIKDHEPDGAGLDRQREASVQMQVRPKISLLVPLHNTPAIFLEDMLASVVGQTYDHWELCLVDGGSDQPETLSVLQKWGERDPRIRLKRLEQNLGIAENTNQALQLATGDFAGCLDHDDLLAPFALYQMVRAINENPECDIFYSDEDRLNEKRGRHTPFFKPDWSPEFLYSCMYLGHLTLYRRGLMNELGGFRSAFDFSQDYDFALRATERARQVCHVQGVLYHWREHPASGSVGGKPDARRSNLAALEDAMQRRGLAADIIEYPTANRVRLKISEWPKVSIIIPTDSPERSRACVEQLPRMTSYPNYEIVIVTNSGLASLLETIAPKESVFRFVRYDKPFNFSDKCNVGAEAATGTHLIFFNDDVESVQRGWIQDLIEPLQNPEVGAVAPKLVYSTGKIQHAGLVSGVRGLVGTACHEWPEDSSDHTNLAQSMRDVSALSAACLAVRREDFMRVGQFDAVNTPINHSDFDLSFKIRQAGLRCVYTPFVKLLHRGHVSIRAAEQEKEPHRDKAGIYLLKRWGGYTCYDPYFPDNMRDWLYADSPTPIRMFGRNNPESPTKSRDLLFISHDLSQSGAPILLLQLAIWCKKNGIFVVTMAPEDGPLRENYQKAGIPIIIDPLIMTGHESFTKFASEFDCILANTIRGEPIVRSAHGANIPVIWWMHETAVGEHYLRTEAKLRSAVSLADVILVPTERTANVYRPFSRSRIKRLSYGIPAVPEPLTAQDNDVSHPIRFLVLGSIEPRKGQDVFVKAVASLPLELRSNAEFHLLGRVMDPEFGDRVSAAAKNIQNFFIEPARDHKSALDALRRCDVLVCSSRDETMPVTILEALSLGKAIISTRVGGIEEALTDGHDALLVGAEDAEGMALAMKKILDDPVIVSSLGEKARETFQSTFVLDRFGADFRELVKNVLARKQTVQLAAVN